MSLEPITREEHFMARAAGNPGLDLEPITRTEYFLKDIADSGGGGGGGASMTSITYAELVALRNAGNLTPGAQYRIVDYVCTVANDTEARAVSHPYDIIVVADDKSTLNENARACLHEGDDYYSAEGAQANLTAWELKYCLDNDTNRFAWADSTNGKGVVFWLKDDWNNECPYDFKQIQFKRYKITACEKAPNLVGTWSVPDIENVTIDVEDYIWTYTFSYITGNGTEDQGIDDWSVVQHGKYVTQDNVIATRFIPSGEIDFEATFEKSFLNNIVWTGYDLTGKGGVEPGIAPIANTFGNNCRFNTFGNGCGSNTFGNDCYSNTFGNDCGSNTFGNNCYSNTFGNNCHSNTFGNDCGFNTFGNNCRSNTFGNDCYSNTFGNNCRFNTFGNDCYSNTFGNNCYSNTFGNDCGFNTFATASGGSTAQNYYRHIALEDGVQYLVLYQATTSSTAYVQNYHVLNGLQGTRNSKINVDANTGLEYCTFVGKNSSGVVKTWSPADLVQS